MGSKPRDTGRILPRLAVAVGGACLACLLFLTAHLWQHRQLVVPGNLGNVRAAASLPTRPGKPGLLKFAVIGDINTGAETFEVVASRLRAEADVDFLVLLGDCAADPTPPLHRYFVSEFRETGLSLPTFIAAGNHDVGAGFSYPEFEALYGPANFSFMHCGSLFVVLGGIHTHDMRQETLNFLARTLREQRAQADMVFVFMHYPPKASPDIPTSDLEIGAACQALFEQYRVTYVFSGHYHRLARTTVNGVVYFVTGGGGARLRRDAFGDIGLLHHLTIMQIRPGSVAERVIPIAPAGAVSRVLERYVERRGLTVLVPFVRTHWLLGGLAGALLAAASAWGLAVGRASGPAGGPVTSAAAPTTRLPDAAGPALTGSHTTVVIPVYNEELRLPATCAAVAAFSAQHADYDFIFVDDGSTDRSVGLIDEHVPAAFADRVRVLSLPRNAGKGAAVKEGMIANRSALVCFIDGDLAYSLDHLPALVRALGSHDVVIGNRSLGSDNRQTIPRLRRILGRGYNRLIHLTLRLPFDDTQAGLKGFRAAAAATIFQRQTLTGFAFDVELLFIARKHGFRIGEIPAYVSATHSEKVSKVRLLRDSVRMALALLRIHRCNLSGRYA